MPRSRNHKSLLGTTVWGQNKITGNLITILYTLSLSVVWKPFLNEFSVACALCFHGGMICGIKFVNLLYKLCGSKIKAFGSLKFVSSISGCFFELATCFLLLVYKEHFMHEKRCLVLISAQF